MCTRTTGRGVYTVASRLGLAAVHVRQEGLCRLYPDGGRVLQVPHDGEHVVEGLEPFADDARGVRDRGLEPSTTAASWPARTCWSAS